MLSKGMSGSIMQTKWINTGFTRSEYGYSYLLEYSYIHNMREENAKEKEKTMKLRFKQQAYQPSSCPFAGS
jgi:hypothetical protein